MAENFIKRLFRWVLWIAGGLALLLVGLHLLLPPLFNTHAVKSRLLRMAGEAIPGQLDAAYLKPHLLPLPHLELTDLRYSLPGKLTLHIDSADIQPQILPLIGGRLQLRTMAVQSPKISIELPDKQRCRTSLEERWLPRDEMQVKDVLAGLPSDWKLHITDGRVILNRDGKLVAQLQGVDLNAAETDGVLSIDTDGTAGAVGQFELDAELDRHTLDAKGAVELTDLKIDAFVEVVEEALSEKLPRGKVDLSVTFESKGLQEYQASIVCSSPDLLIEKEGRLVRIEKTDLQGTARLTPQRLDASLKRLRMAAPRVDLSGKLVWEWGQKAASSPLHLSVQAGQTDVTRLRSELLALFPELQRWRLFEVIQGGTLISMEMNSSGASWDQIGRLKQLTISGRAIDSRIFVPGAELNLTQVDGEWQLNSGELIVRNATAHLDNTRGTDGLLRLGLADDPKTMNLDIQIDADLSEVPPVLKQLISKPEVLAEIDRIKTLEGTVSGRLLLSGDLNRPDVDVSVSNVDMNADYQRLPKAVTLLGGPFNAWLKQGSFGLEGAFQLQGDVDLSTRMKVGENQLDIQQLAISDPLSSADVVLRYDKAGRIMDLRFEGKLDLETMAKVWPLSRFGGRVNGRFSAKVTVDRPLSSTLGGYLEAADLTLPIASLGVVHIAHADAAANEDTLNIKQLDLSYAKQRAELSGTVHQADAGLVLDLKLAGKEIDLDSIMAAWGKAREKPPAQSDHGSQGLGMVRGTIDTQVDRLVYDGRVLDALQATVTLLEDQTTIAVQQGNLCGISITGLMRRTPKGIWIDSEQQAEKQTLQLAGECLVKGQTTERLEGTFDIKGTLAASGQTQKELISHLRGGIDLNVADGRVFNVGSVGLFTNILEYLSFKKLIMGGHPSMRGRDFKFSSFQLQLQLRDGLAKIKTVEVRADALNMVAEGTLDIATQQLDLTVLVSPLTSVDAVVRHLPVVGKILNGTLIAIPVGVKGPLRDPEVIPLSPSAVGARLTGVLGRILKAPIQLVEPIFQSSEPEVPEKKEPSEKSDTPASPVLP